MMRVVVTAATGDVGSGVLRALVDDPAVESGAWVGRRRASLDLLEVSWVSAVVATEDLTCFDGADAVIHRAWR